MPLPKVLTGLFSGGASKIVDSVKGVISEFHLSPEDKLKAEQAILDATNKHIEVMEQEFTKQFEIQMKEMDSARKREIDIVTSDKAPLLNKIITPLLAMLILGSTFIFWYIIIFKDITKEKEVLISGIIGSLTTVSMGVVGYYFGSSIGSANKQSQIDKYINK
jgi:hypothetical protein